MRFACWLVGAGVYLAAKPHVRAQLRRRSFGASGRQVLVAYADWCDAVKAEQTKAARHVKPNRRRG